MPLPFAIEDLLPIAWSKGQVVQVKHFCHNDRRTAALAGIYARISPGEFGVIAHAIPEGSEQQLVGVSGHAITVLHDFFALTPSGELLVVSKGTTEQVLSFLVETGRARASVADRYYVLVGRNEAEETLCPTVMKGDVPLKRDNITLTAEDTRVVARYSSNHQALLPIGVVKRGEAGFEVESDWSPAVSTIDVALGISSASWHRFCRALEDVLTKCQRLSAQDLGATLRRRAEAWQALSLRLCAVPGYLRASNGTRIDELVVLYGTLAEWEQQYGAMLGVNGIVDETDVCASRSMRNTSEVLDGLTRALVRLRERCSTI
jgi:hypothetical protein